MGCACLKSDVIVKNQKINRKENIREDKNEIKNENIIFNREKKHEFKENKVNIERKILSRAISLINLENNHNNRKNSSQINVISKNVNDVRNAVNRHSLMSIQRESFNINNLENNNHNRINHVPGDLGFLPSNFDPNFNFPELDGVMKGRGLKMMKGYVSHISEEDLQKKRAEFWGDIYEFLNAAGVTPINNCINLTYDSRGYYYEIPNYCLNDPHLYDVKTISIPKQKPPIDEIEIIIRKVIEDKSYTVFNLSTILNLKNEIASTFFNNTDYQVKSEQIRLFYSGKELNNDQEIWEYNIKDGSILQMMVKSA